jgi:ATP-dependent helicase/nuclease subunit B
MATIFYDSAFDDRVYVGDDLAPGRAVSATAWMGLAGLLEFLETRLGLGGLPVSEGERCVHFAQALAGSEGFWNRSLDTDAVGTSREILRWVDELKMMGWAGAGCTDRIRQLSTVASSVLPGIPDRLRSVLTELERTADRIEPLTIHPVQPADDMPPLLGQVFADLVNRHGAVCEEIGIQDVEASGNLGASRARGFRPQPGDDSLVLLRTHTPWAAAEHVAAWLASLDDAGGTVVIGATPELDATLARFGLPTSGGTRPGPRANMLASLIPLILGAAEPVPDPSRALELLTLPGGPFPSWVGRRLARALHEFPGIGNDGWTAVAGSLATLAEERGHDGGERWESRVGAIFAGLLPDLYANSQREEISACLEAVLIPWLEERASASRHAGVYRAVHTATRDLIELLEGRGSGPLEPGEFLRLWGEIPCAAGASLYPAEAGIDFVDSPGAVLAPARRIIWWDFCGKNGRSSRPLPLSLEEYRDLADNGVHLQEFYHACARCEPLRWQRPWRLCSETLVLASPVLSATGDASHPHPFWDELCATMAGDNAPEILTRDGPIAEAAGWTMPATVSPPRPRRRWGSPGGVGHRETESPSGLERLLRCPFAWVAQYKGRLTPGIVRSLPTGGLLDGKLFHEIFRQLPDEAFRSPDDAVRAALALFRERGPALAGAYFRAGGQSPQAAFERKLGESVAAVTRWLNENGMQVAGREEDLRGTVSGMPFAGRLDLRAYSAGASTVLDFKNGSESEHLKGLKGNTAVQLISYATLAEQTLVCRPAALYFILKSRHFLPSRDAHQSGSPLNNAAGLHARWGALESAYGEALEALNEHVVAAGVPDEEQDPPAKDQWINDQIQLVPNCDFCELGMLCGKWLGEK